MQTIAIGFFSKQKIGDYVYRLGYDVTALGELLEEGILPFITSILYLAALPFLVGGLLLFNRRIARATKQSEFYNSVAYSFIEDTLTHLKIIQAFSQENKKTQVAETKTLGLGLGLYISNDIIKAHNGVLMVESELEVCSIFSFSLPLQKSPEEEVMTN